MLTDCLPCILVLWGRVSRQPKLDHLVLCTCESVERVNQFWKNVGKVETILNKEVFYKEISVCLNLWKEGLYVYYDSESTLTVKISFVKYKVF